MLNNKKRSFNEISGRLRVIKRDGNIVPVLRGEIEKRIIGLAEMNPPLSSINLDYVIDKTINGLVDKIHTSELDRFAAETAAAKIVEHPEYNKLASRIVVSNNHKETDESILKVCEKLYYQCHPRTSTHIPVISDMYWNLILQHHERIQKELVFDRDFDVDYFGFNTLCKGYLLGTMRYNQNGVAYTRLAERIQHAVMRVALEIHRDDNDLADAFESYEFMSKGYFTHATPTRFNAGTPMNQLSSCFLLSMKEDSIEGIYDTLKRCAMISKGAGGIGLAISNVRANNSYIAGTGGLSNGIIPMIKVFNDTARYVDQGGGKRKGAMAIYLETWHSDIFDFLNLKTTSGDPESKSRDIFLGLWIPDLFMERVEKNLEWSLFCPNEAKGLEDVWGEEFEKLYLKYESTTGLARMVVRAQDLWYKIIDTQMETGNPYMLYKDAANRKSNQQNLGTIKSSNLCTEIIEYSSPDEIAVCNLSSIALPKFVKDGVFDHELLFRVVRIVVRNLNKIIDRQFYALEECRKSNLNHRPIGVGVQGLAETFFMMRYPFESNEASVLNRDIFETIYYAAVYESNQLAEISGPYSSYKGSPISKGIFQFDMWNVTPSNRWPWEELRKNVLRTGVRNSLLTAPMPTASTSQILGNTECFEPITSNLFTRRVLAGNYIVLNEFLVHDLIRLDLWNSEIVNKIILDNGSIAAIEEIPQEMKDLYKTVWEISQKKLIDMSADRGAFIDQSQSFNVFVAKPTRKRLESIHLYGFKKGLKTGMYYVKMRPNVEPIKMSLGSESVKKRSAPEELNMNDIALKKTKTEENIVGTLPLFCTKEMMEAGCDSCGS